MKRKILIFGIFGFLCFAYCQEIRIPPKVQHQQFQRNIENDLLVRMINEIEITDDQMPEFISKFREISQLIKKHRETREKFDVEIRHMIEGQESIRNIDEKIIHLDKLYQQLNENIRKIRDDIRKSLNPKQQVKLVLMLYDMIEPLTPTGSPFPVQPPFPPVESQPGLLR